MSLSINFILPHEQRSGSKVNAKTILKIFAVSLPLMLLVLMLQQGVSYYALQTNLRIQESRWESAEPRQRSAQRLQGRLNRNTQVKAEIEAWRESTPHWDSAMLAVMESTPADIQIITLRMQAAPAPNQPRGGSPPLRRPTLLIEGRVREPDAMPNILTLKQTVEEHALMQETMQSAEVVNFAAASSQAAERVRVFSLRFRFEDLPTGQ